MVVFNYGHALDLSNFLKLGRNVDKKLLELFIELLVHLYAVVTSQLTSELAAKTLNFENYTNYTVFYVQCDTFY